MSNVRRVIHIPPWGTEELVEVPFSRIYLHKQETTFQVIEEEFVTLMGKGQAGLAPALEVLERG